MNIGSYVALNARRHPKKWALTCEERVYTYEQFNQKVNHFAWGLLNLGVKKGEKVALFMTNSDYFAISYFAILKIGAVAVPVNFRLVSREVHYILNQSETAVIICDVELKSVIEQAREGVRSVRRVITAGNGEGADFQMVMKEIDDEPNIDVSSTDDAHIIYTSGTTGHPKGAVFDHERVLKVAIGISGVLGLQVEDRLLHVAPLFHCAQLCLFLIPGFFLGTSHVIQREFHPVEVLKNIDTHKISLFFGVPTMYNYLFQVPNVENYNLSSIKRCCYGAAPMAPELVKKSMNVFQTKQFYNLCGLTEGGPTGIYLTPEDHQKHLGKSGKTPLLFTEVNVVNIKGQEVVPGEVGELILRGETIMKEYYKKPKETEDALQDGWLFTGDLATKDEEGYITLVDRKKDMIISGGENVYSVEVEHVLYEHPNVLEAAVIGTPDPQWGEVVTAVVVVKEGESLIEEEVKQLCRNQLAGYKVPKKIVFADQLPRNASGKIQKFKLRDTFNVQV
ncbi:class I adenylate-forming enzyme family protein [Metabacillus iocasae]|uniref:Feruloyl-CoA synthase n=1 Tax=Priestia iocasae TaxID=2291674 RepID=A0ABS2QSC2_9BACI|nr:long-chain-fatty-acid--CoA ligase [Metabacillus iocasae]MBM7702203.1 feruloyl-CoA synthase [Metabacillus iocasae]